MTLGMNPIFLFLIVVNIIGFVLFGIDKRRAIKHAWRIPEKTLFGVAIIGGSVGATLGMHLFRHKTKHMSFVIGMPMILAIQMTLVVVAHMKGMI